MFANSYLINNNLTFAYRLFSKLKEKFSLSNMHRLYIINLLIFRTSFIVNTNTFNKHYICTTTY